MKKVFKFILLAFVFACMTALYSCKKDEAEIPALNTAPVSVISATTAEAGGIIHSDGGDEIIARGVFWGTGETQYPATYGTKTTDGAGPGAFSTNITGLTSNSTYYVMAYATNNSGTAYGEILRFTTPVNSEILFNPELTYGSIADIDGNTYKTIQIGTQSWMAENLRTTKYNDGAPIPNVSEDDEWQNLNEYGLQDSARSAFCWYDNDASSYKSNYGALYNWYAVNTGKLCPAGWHVPSYDEWMILAEHLGGLALAGGKLKETGTSHWLTPNEGATNESGFTAVPGGYRGASSQSNFWSINSRTGWWSSDQHWEPIGGAGGEIPAGFAANTFGLGTEDSGFGSGSNRNLTSGLSVRCVEDN